MHGVPIPNNPEMLRAVTSTGRNEEMKRRGLVVLTIKLSKIDISAASLRFGNNCTFISQIYFP